MKNLRTILAACILGVALGACGDASSPLTAPDRPNRNGGGFGSGHRTPVDTGSTTAAPSSTEATADSTTLRNGGGFGSGH